MKAYLTSQENGFSPVCVCMWVFKWELVENADPHTSQENGFSPVCVRMWVFFAYSVHDYHFRKWNWHSGQIRSNPTQVCV